jgi:hypothetical protein
MPSRGVIQSVHLPGREKSVHLLMRKDASHQEAFKLLGQEFTVSDSLIKSLETFTCTLYGGPRIQDIYRCRYKLFCAKNGEIESVQLPVCNDRLRKHILRADYQAAI